MLTVAADSTPLLGQRTAASGTLVAHLLDRARRAGGCVGAALRGELAGLVAPDVRRFPYPPGRLGRVGPRRPPERPAVAARRRRRARHQLRRAAVGPAQRRHACTTARSSPARPGRPDGAVLRAGRAAGRRRGAWVHTPSSYVAAQVRELLGTERGPGRSPTGRPTRDRARGRGAARRGCDGRPYVLAVGTREPRKNLARLVEAFGLLHPDHPDASLVLVGPDGADRPNIDAAIERPRRRARPDQVLVTAGWLDDQPAGRRPGRRRGRWPTRRSTRASASHCSRRMRRGVPVVAAGPAPSRRSPETPPSSSTPSMPTPWPPPWLVPSIDDERCGPGSWPRAGTGRGVLVVDEGRRPSLTPSTVMPPWTPLET